MLHSNILFRTGAAILSTKATRAFGSAFSKSKAIFSFSDGGSAFRRFQLITTGSFVFLDDFVGRSVDKYALGGHSD
jgi:hypothetical protein